MQLHRCCSDSMPETFHTSVLLAEMIVRCFAAMLVHLWSENLDVTGTRLRMLHRRLRCLLLMKVGVGMILSRSEGRDLRRAIRGIRHC